MALRLPQQPVARQILLVQVIDKLGTGLYVSIATLYLLLVQHQTRATVGIILGAVGVGGLVGGPIIGRLADHASRVRILQILHLVRAAAFGCYAFASHSVLLAGLGALIGFCDRGAAATNQVLVNEVGGEGRAELRGWYRAISNGAIGVGSLAGAGLVAIHIAWLFRLTILIDSASFLLCAATLNRRLAWPIPKIASNAGPPHYLPSPRLGAFMAADAVLLTNVSWIRVGLPLWILTKTSFNVSVAPLALTLNTVLVVLIQRAASRRMQTASEARFWVVVAGIAMAIAGGCVAISQGASRLQGLFALAGATCLFTAVEIIQSSTSWELALALAPNDHQGATLGWYQLVRGAEEGFGPLFLAIMIGFGKLGVLVACLAAMMASVLERALFPAREHWPVAKTD